MISKIKIDQLLLFFLLSIAFLLFSFGKELLFENQNQQSGLTKYFEIENEIDAPKQGLVSFNDSIQVYDSSLEFWYSTNGGEDFTLSKEFISINEIVNSDIIHFPTSLQWKQPIGNFEGCKSLVVQLKNKADNSLCEKRVYTFLTNEIENLPVIALTLPENNLFGEDDGIMTYGENSFSDKGFYNAWWNCSANFTNRGFESEKQTFFQYFENGKLMTEQYCGIRISGNATRGFPQKSMQIVARKMYGNDQFDFPFFDESGKNKYTSLVIRNSGNDNTKTMFADLFMHRLAENSNVLTLKGKPTIVYINGNYWGIYNLRERIDEYLIAEIEDVKESEVTILEGGAADLKDGSERDKAKFDLFMEKIREKENVDDKLYAEFSEVMDMASFIDYIFFETYFGNKDWPNNNSTWYKAGEGKWKWILNDLDYSLAYQGQQNVNINLFEKLKKSESVVGYLFQQLMTNQNFKEQFVQRSEEIITENLSLLNVTNCSEELKTLYQPEMKKHIDRWRMIGTIEDWEQNCKMNLDFLTKRRLIYLDQLHNLK